MIVYFVDKHVFLPREKREDDDLQKFINRAGRALDRGDGRSKSRTQILALEKRKEDLELELFNANDSYNGEPKDEVLINRLTQEIKDINTRHRIWTCGQVWLR